MLKLVLLTIVFSFNELGKADKGKQLTILAFWPLTGEPLFDGETCKAAMNVAVSNVNNRQDILPDYDISVSMEDEGPNGLLARGKLLNYFLQNHSVEEINNTLAPIVIAPYFSTGCKSLASLLHHLNLVGIATSCSTPEITGQRRIYPNLYRIRLPGELALYTRLKFIITQTSWRSVGVITNAASSRDYSMAVLFYNEGFKLGINVTNFEAVFGRVTSDVLESFIANDVRIIVIDSTTVSFVVDFLCKTHEFGITGSRYAFVAQANAYVDPNDLPEKISSRCSRGMILEQLRYTVWTGMITQAILNTNSSLGYNLDEFEALYDKAVKKHRTSEYRMRHICHDAMMHTLLTIDKAEKALSKVGLTLADFMRKPKVIMAAMNKSCAEADYFNLHAGHAKYSSRLEMDYEPQNVQYHSEQNGNLSTIFYVDRPKNSSPFDMANYIFRQIDKLKWATADIAPPRDGMNIVEVDDSYMIKTFSTSVTLSVILTLLQLWFFLREPKVHFHYFKLLILCGCISLNVASSSFLWQYFSKGSSGAPVCILQATFVSFALILTNASLLSRLALSMKGTIKLAARITVSNSSSRPSGTVTRLTSLNERFNNVTEADRRIARNTSILLVLNIVGVAMWLSEHDLKQFLKTLVILGTYDEEHDSVTNYRVNICDFHFSSYRFIALAVLHSLIIAANAFYNISLQRKTVLFWKQI